MALGRVPEPKRRGGRPRGREAGTFTAQCRFVGVQDALRRSETLKLSFVSPGDYAWEMPVTQRGLYLAAVNSTSGAFVPRTASFDLRLMLREAPVERRIHDYHFGAHGDDRGFSWAKWGYSFDEATSEQNARARDTLVTEVTVFKLERGTPSKPKPEAEDAVPS